MVELPDPIPVTPELEIITAVPIVEDDFDAYGLVRHDPPVASDFEPITRTRAEREAIPELVRTGVSHYLTAQQAETVRVDPSSMIARVRIRKDRGIHVARTRLSAAGHIEVWARPSALKDDGEVVEAVG